MLTITEHAAVEDVSALADHFRVRSIEMADRAGSGHPTSSMSAADLVAVLLARHLRIEPGAPDDVGNDRLVFSKGHASPLLYAALEAIGALHELAGFDDAVDAYRQPGSILEGHPTPLIPGVPAATGSLGLGVAIGVGLAIGNKMSGSDAHVWVVCGDGELAEGAV
jgi:transketolase